MLNFDWYIRETIKNANLRAAIERAQRDRLFRFVLAPSKPTSDEPGEVET